MMRLRTLSSYGRYPLYSTIKAHTMYQCKDNASLDFQPTTLLSLCYYHVYFPKLTPFLHRRSVSKTPPILTYLLFQPTW